MNRERRTNSILLNGLTDVRGVRGRGGAKGVSVLISLVGILLTLLSLIANCWALCSNFLPGESQGQRSLVGCRLWGRTESDTTEAI